VSHARGGQRQPVAFGYGRGIPEEQAAGSACGGRVHVVHDDDGELEEQLE
jgi:hypothetical protein